MTPRLWYSWSDAGTAEICTYADGVRTVVRPAIDADHAAMADGRMSYDRDRDPRTAAWDRLAQTAD